jgi:hypothetical protein
MEVTAHASALTIKTVKIIPTVFPATIPALRVLPIPSALPAMQLLIESPVSILLYVFARLATMII